MKTKRRWRWVSRDIDMYDIVDISQSEIKPTRNGCIWITNGFIVAVCSKEFTELFGITIKPGECVKVTFADAKCEKRGSKSKRPNLKGK